MLCAELSIANEPNAPDVRGVTSWTQVARLAESQGLPVTSHGIHDLHVHLLAAVPNASFLEVHAFGLDHFLSEPLVIEGGEAVAPSRPGHGVQFDWKALASHACGMP